MRIRLAPQALRGRPATPRPGEIVVDHAPAGERIEINRVLARDGLSWRVLDSRGQVLSIEATATGGVWASKQLSVIGCQSSVEAKAPIK